MTATYNEIDEYAADWISNLITAGHVAPGRIDTRSITELTAEDVRHARQAHFFAGIAVWSAAARAAGWPDDAPLWTGSCPCQPFSQAGRGKGVKDERHLWPEWFRLIRECMPPVIVGEQVASPAGLGWLDAVFADLEGAGYACAAADLCAASVGAPHIRQRLYFVAYSQGNHDRPCLKLGGAAKLASWPTTRSADGKSGGIREVATGQDLSTVAHWATPQVHDTTGAKTPEQIEAMKERGRAKGHVPGISNLNEQVQLVTNSASGSTELSTTLTELPPNPGAHWPTPAVTNADRGGDIRRWNGEQSLGGRRSNLQDAVMSADPAAWRTPTSLTHSTETNREAGDSCSLRHTRLMASGALPTGSTAPTAKRAQLNPAHSRWLMGLLPAWDDCAPMATRLYGPRRKHSSKS